jgi:tRNA threonylcarbamoyl adenosine modification protein YeaZ
MYYLILDTSSPRGLFAILKDRKILLKQEIAFGVRESNELVPVIEMGLRHLKLSIDEINTLILSKGPGSFTGLRIGASVVKALSFAKGIPIRTIDSLKCFDPIVNGSFAVLLDAKAKGTYLQKGLKENHEVYYEDKSHILNLDELKEASSQIPTIITSHKSSFKNKLDNELFFRLIEMTPDAVQMLKMAFKIAKTTPLNSSDILDLEYFNTP